jgi:hypothetical protein
MAERTVPHCRSLVSKVAGGAEENEGIGGSRVCDKFILSQVQT